MCFLVFVCFNLIIFFIASLNKIMNTVYGFLLMSLLIESTLKDQVNTFSHVLTPPRDRHTEREVGWTSDSMTVPT